MFRFCLCLLVLVSAGAAEVWAADGRTVPVRVFTHGEGEYALLQEDGSLKGRGIDLLTCAMGKLGTPYTVKTAAMARSYRMEADDLIDIWFPTYNKGEVDSHRPLYGNMGEMTIFWFLKPMAALLPSDPAFKDQAKVSSFPGSTPDRLLQRLGYNHVRGTDESDRLFLMLIEGRIDAILAGDFRDLLSPRFGKLASKLKVYEYATFPMAFELIPSFVQKNPEFPAHFSTALKGC